MYLKYYAVANYQFYIARYSTGQFQPPIDASSQVTQQMAINSDGMMRMQFMRPIISEDNQVLLVQVVTSTVDYSSYTIIQLLNS